MFHVDADGSPPSIFSCECLVLPRALIYSCDLNHTHEGMKALVSVSAARVCRQAKGVQCVRIVPNKLG